MSVWFYFSIDLRSDGWGNLRELQHLATRLLRTLLCEQLALIVACPPANKLHEIDLDFFVTVFVLTERNLLLTAL